MTTPLPVYARLLRHLPYVFIICKSKAAHHRRSTTSSSYHPSSACCIGKSTLYSIFTLCFRYPSPILLVSYHVIVCLYIFSLSFMYIYIYILYLFYIYIKGDRARERKFAEPIARNLTHLHFYPTGTRQSAAFSAIPRCGQGSQSRNRAVAPTSK